MLRIVAVVAAALALAPAAAQARDRCAPHGRQHVVARSGRAVVFVASYEPELDQDITVLTGCSRRTGRRRRIDELSADFYGGDVLGRVRIAGTHVVYEVGFDDPKGGIADGFALFSADAVHDAPPVVIADPAWLGGGRTTAWDLGPGGEVAWLADTRAVLLWTARDGARVVDEGAVLGGPRLTAERLAWTHDGRPMSRALRRTPTRCHLDPAHGSPELDATRLSDALVVCRRATGVTLRVPLAGGDPTGDRIGFGGAYAAARVDGATLLFDTVAGTVETIVAAGQGDAVVDEHGDLAWTTRDPSVGWRLWVRDGSGLRVLDAPAAGPDLTRDGEAVLWGDLATAFVARG